MIKQWKAGSFIIFKTLQQAMLLHSNNYCMAWMIKQEIDSAKRYKTLFLVLPHLKYWPIYAYRLASHLILHVN